MPNVDIDWQVKNTITLLVALNEMRNQFVYSYLDEERKDEHLMTGIDEAEFSNVKVVVTIRFIDLLIQVIHHLLSPLRHLESSDYPNLNALFEVISAPMITNVNGDLAEESDIHSRKLRDKTAMMMDDTFPLTEVTLTADPVHGAPRGILSLLDEFQRHKKIYRSQSPLSKPLDSSNNNSRSNSPSRQYMNRTSPRTLPLNIDEVLDMLERRSRSNSPEATHRPATDTLERHLAQGSVDSNDDARKYAFQLLEEVIKVDESVADDEGFISLALPQTEVIPFPVKLADQSISSVGSSKPPDFTNYNKFIKMYDKNRPADTDNDYLDYTRFVFNKDHIISNAYVKQTRRALSASSRERKVRIQGVGIVGSVDTNNDRTRQDFPRVHYCGSSSREGTSGVRPYSAHPPGPEIRPKQPTEYTPGLDTINSVASAGVEEAGSVTLNKMNDSSTLATGGSVVPRPPQGNKRSIVHRDMKVMQRAGVPSGSTSAPQSPHHIHRNVVPPAVKYSRSELPEGERAPSTNGAIELTGNNLLFGPQLGTQQGVRSQAILMNRDRGGAPTQSTKRPQSANRTRTIPNDSATQPPAARYYYAPTPTKTLFTATSDDKDNAVLNLKETQIGEYVSSHAKVVDPLSISRDLGGTASEQVTEIARQQAYRQGLLSVQGKKRTTSDGDYGGSSRERVTNAVLFM
ncbi:hypothetical protein EON65_27355 [archaeon]|nr:MAG: hypothetical protein EON65_27355 [archaeon]